MQGRHCYPAQASRHALDRPRLQCHHRPTLLKTQWTLSGLLGAQSRTWGQGSMTHHFLVVHPTKEPVLGTGWRLSFPKPPPSSSIALLGHYPRQSPTAHPCCSYFPVVSSPTATLVLSSVLALLSLSVDASWITSNLELPAIYRVAIYLNNDE